MIKKATTRKPPQILQLRIDLAHIKPPVWRRVLVPDNIKLSKLHDVIQAALGWKDCHLHQFEIAGKQYGIPDPEFDFEPVIAETRITLVQALNGTDKFRYVYDFGDNWEHLVKVEKIIPPDESQRIFCLAGKNACPPEDVGGPWGYVEFLAALCDPEHPEHESFIEWHGESFDPKACDLDEINLRLVLIKT